MRVSMHPMMHSGTKSAITVRLKRKMFIYSCCGHSRKFISASAWGANVNLRLMDQKAPEKPSWDTVAAGHLHWSHLTPLSSPILGELQHG